ncbi:MAG TPA: acyltransferase [Terracidiphilus sp.]|nr:acyltransferase [Terracidiphilus sp.]
MSYLWKTLRPQIASIKKNLVNRPAGLKQLGNESVVKRPWRFEGKKHIEIGSRTVIFFGSNICAVEKYRGGTFTPSVLIGDDVYIGHYAFITAINCIEIGNGSVLSEHVYITDFFHGLDPQNGLIMEQPLESKGPVKIGKNCFLGYRASVMPAVTLGDWCIVGANSVVTRSFPSYSMIAGSPARLLKTYSHELGRWVAPSSGMPNGGPI